jgi:hypothetical protein
MSPTPSSDRLAAYLARLDEVGPALARMAVAFPGLTEPDAGTGERWEAGQVWAHLAEIVPYWIAELRRVLDEAHPEPVPFGRVKGDAGRLAAIEAGRHEPVTSLAADLASAIEELRGFLAEVDAQAGGWERRGLHSKLGEMDVPAAVEEFLVGHLEEHLDQLELLAGAAGSGE